MSQLRNGFVLATLLTCSASTYAAQVEKTLIEQERSSMIRAEDKGMVSIVFKIYKFYEGYRLYDPSEQYQYGGLMPLDFATNALLWELTNMFEERDKQSHFDKSTAMFCDCSGELVEQYGRVHFKIYKARFYWAPALDEHGNYRKPLPLPWERYPKRVYPGAPVYTLPDDLRPPSEIKGQ
ncbi:hypothetical protein KDM89_16105 [Undibacterium sp. LFS511W]|uniref:Uncharacterized protein n=1 Tax=Undibacterium luofuense TaxID=2828733 RepID=A0A941I8E5_9BURK|nr:hypothetical protein [Undibacterium luofuense]